MAACLQSKIEFGGNTNVSTENIEFSRTDEFVRNHLLNEIWRTNELSPFISKLVTKIKLADGRLLESQTKEPNSANCHESISYGCDTKHCNGAEKLSEYQRVYDQARER